METKENLAKAVIAVMKAVKGMEKNSHVSSGSYGYNGTKDQDVKEVFNTALAENGLCVLPIDIQDETQIDRWMEGSKSKQSVFTKVKTKYLLLHESGESVEIAGYGHGIDTQDKGAGKATTYALKNTLLYTFITPVGKIDDTDTTHSNDIDQPQEITKAKAPATKTTSQQKTDKKYTEKDLTFGVSDKLNFVSDAAIAKMIASKDRDLVVTSLIKYRWGDENKKKLIDHLTK